MSPAGQPDEEVGLRLRSAREARDLTLRELARRLDLSASALSQIETGKSRPSVKTLYAIVSELGISLEEIVVSGGGSTSPLTMRIVADCFGIPASRSVESGGASLGAAICAAAAAGLYPDIETAAAAMTKARESFSPDPANVAVYRRLDETVYRHIRDATDPLLERSYPIFH